MKKILSIVFLVLFFVFLALLAFEKIRLYNEGQRAQQEANEILKGYEAVKEENSQGEEESEPLSELTTEAVKQEISFPEAIGILEIDCIGLRLPILAETNDELLKKSICRYSKNELGAEGNFIVCGHNYRNGAHFGQLDKMKKGDIARLIDKNGVAYEYKAYEIKVIEETDFAFVNKTHSPNELTLFTCNDKGDKRVAIKLELVS